MADDPMWCMVLFDLPTKTAAQRREYAAFRNLLLDNGFVRTQYSVYARYSPAGILASRIVSSIKGAVPPQGEVRILHVTDRQWAATLRFFKRPRKLSKTNPSSLPFSDVKQADSPLYTRKNLPPEVYQGEGELIPSVCGRGCISFRSLSGGRRTDSQRLEEEERVPVKSIRGKEN